MLTLICPRGVDLSLIRSFLKGEVMRVISIVPETTVDVPENPLFQYLHDGELVVVSGKLSNSEIFSRVEEIIHLLPCREKFVVILSAFMNPSGEDVVEGAWNPSREKLSLYLDLLPRSTSKDSDKTSILRGLQLLWFLRNRYGKRIVFLISLDEIRVEGFVLAGMSITFSENLFCTFIYPRGSPDDWFESLINSVRARIAIRMRR